MDLSSLPLSPKQIRSIAESARHRISLWSGAVRSGKTIASLVAFLIAIAAAPSSGLVLIVGRSLQTIERNILDPLQDPALFGPLARHVQHTRGATTAVILGRVVHLIGASDARAEGRLRGLTACLALADELTLLPEAFLNQLLGRLSVPGSRLLGTTNPDSPTHWLKQNYLDRAHELDLGHWHFTLDDNPSLDPAYVTALKAEYGPGTLWYDRFILGLWKAAEGAVYGMFDESRHVVDILPTIQTWFALGIDYGTQNPLHAVLVGLGVDGRLYVGSEWRYDGRRSMLPLTDLEYSERLRGWLASLRPPGSHMAGVHPQYVVVDPSAASFIQQLHRDRLTPVVAENAVLDGIRTVSSLLASGKLLIHRSCTELIREIQGYVWDPKAALLGEDKPLKSTNADHGLDALRYALQTTESLWRRQIEEVA
ncbi:PBSX family phage terminase large subunit [Streptomyces sp. 5-8]|uniref:PBSX family phage terminase large subunit n=1 Tax=Streptomyces musisoli TaxID=2802280 RepID=A0ABS1NXY2_9ACTN|nr:PBSX family phage terminase large subunit [Streptomyces musisoli]MBL1104933.1 PBSX family phage terminase large subunit [Streptomyces musisoli]